MTDFDVPMALTDFHVPLINILGPCWERAWCWNLGPWLACVGVLHERHRAITGEVAWQPVVASV